MPDISFEQAVVLAKSGDADAQYAVSSALYAQGQFDESLRWLRLAAAQHVVPAQLALASLLMDGLHCPLDRDHASALLRPLAATNVQASLLLGELHGFAGYQMTDRELALRHVAAAARMGDAGARHQLGLLAVCHALDLARGLLDAAAAVDWTVVEQAVPQLAQDLPLPAGEVLSADPLIRRFPSAIPPIVAEHLIRLAAPHVRRSQIVDARTGVAREDPMRNSSHVTFSPRQHDHVLEAIERCISRVAGTPASHSELSQVLRYRIGEEFKPHVDYFNESGAGTYKSLADGGQRAHTVLVYLNDGYGGGTTCFPELSLDIRGRRGDLVYFHNLGPDGRGDKRTLHAGAPVTAGEKWLLSQWIRADSYPPRVRW